MKAFTKFVGFVGTGIPPAQLLGFQASEETREQVRYLIGQEKQGVISPEEKNELDDFEQFEHIIRIAEARLRQHGAG